MVHPVHEGTRSVTECTAVPPAFDIIILHMRSRICEIDLLRMGQLLACIPQQLLYKWSLLAVWDMMRKR